MWSSAPASLTPTFRYHPSIVAQAFGTLGAMFPDRVVLGVGTGESLNEVPASGMKWPGVQGAARPAARGDRADPQAVDRGAGHLRGPVLPDRKRDDLRQARRTRCRSGSPPPGRSRRQMAGADRRGLYLHQRQGARSSTPRPAAQGRGGPRQAPAAPRDGIERMIEMKVSFDTDAAARHGGHPALGGAGALAGGEGRRSRTRSRWSGSPMRCRSSAPPSRWIVSTDPDEQVERIRPYVELGFRHLVFHAPGPDQARFLQALCRAGRCRCLRAKLRHEAMADARHTRLDADARARHHRWSSRATISARSPSRRSRPTGWRRPTAMSLVVAQKIVSKAEGRLRRSRRGRAVGTRPIALAAEVDKDPRLVEVILVGIEARRAPPPEAADRRASARLRHGQCRRRPIERRDAMMARERVLLLPRRPGRRRPRALRAALWPRLRRARSASSSATASAGPGAQGTVGIALGAAGLPALIDLRGQPDLFGRTLQVTETGFADEIAAAASLLMGQADEGVPVVLVRGLALVGAGACRPPRWSGRRSTICSGDRPTAGRSSRCRAASAAPSWRSASIACCRRAS